MGNGEFSQTYRYLFNIGELNSYISHTLLNVIGPEALVNNYYDIIHEIYDCAIYRYTDYNYEHLTYLVMEYGVDYNVAKEVIVNAQTMVSQSTRFLPRDCDYTMELIPEHPEVLILVRVLVNTTDRALEEAWSSKVIEEYENGAWLPERERELLSAMRHRIKE